MSPPPESVEESPERRGGPRALDPQAETQGGQVENIMTLAPTLVAGTLMEDGTPEQMAAAASQAMAVWDTA
eukprot:4124612-Heterocapsa_arctica.AAC.1